MSGVNRSNEELKNFFSFLAGDENNTLDVADASLLIFGLENYGLPLTNTEIQKIKNEIDEKKSQEGKITFEDFKSLWDTNINTKLNKKEVTENVNQLIFEFLENSEYTKDRRKQDENYEPKLDVIQLYTMMEQLGVFKEILFDEKTNNESDKKDSKSEEDQKKDLVKKMIENLAANGEEVTSQDLEYLIEVFLSNYQN
jgi:hypothetical protein